MQWFFLALTATVIFLVVLASKLSQKKFAKERIICFFWKHDIAKNELVHEGGALFRGGICKRCKRFRFGKFVFNIWDEGKTEKKDGVICLSGLNPRIETEGWEILGDYCELMQISETLCSKDKVKVLVT